MSTKPSLNDFFDPENFNIDEILEQEHKNIPTVDTTEDEQEKKEEPTLINTESSVSSSEHPSLFISTPVIPVIENGRVTIPNPPIEIPSLFGPAKSAKEEMLGDNQDEPEERSIAPSPTPASNGSIHDDQEFGHRPNSPIFVECTQCTRFDDQVKKFEETMNEIQNENRRLFELTETQQARIDKHSQGYQKFSEALTKFASRIVNVEYDATKVKEAQKEQNKAILAIKRTLEDVDNTLAGHQTYIDEAKKARLSFDDLQKLRETGTKTRTFLTSCVLCPKDSSHILHSCPKFPTPEAKFAEFKEQGLCKTCGERCTSPKECPLAWTPCSHCINAKVHPKHTHHLMELCKSFSNAKPTVGKSSSRVKSQPPREKTSSQSSEPKRQDVNHPISSTRLPAHFNPMMFQPGFPGWFPLQMPMSHNNPFVDAPQQMSALRGQPTKLVEAQQVHRQPMYQIQQNGQPGVQGAHCQGNFQQENVPPPQHQQGTSAQMYY